MKLFFGQSCDHKTDFDRLIAALVSTKKEGMAQLQRDQWVDSTTLSSSSSVSSSLSPSLSYPINPSYYYQPSTASAPPPGSLDYVPSSTSNNSNNSTNSVSFVSLVTSPSSSVDEKKSQMDQKFADLVKMHELPVVTQQHLQVLKDCKIIMLCDDSSSMLSPIAEEGTDPFVSKTSTRWMELKKLAAAAIQTVTAINADGLDVYFLNRPPILNVHAIAEVAGAFLLSTKWEHSFAGSSSKTLRCNFKNFIFKTSLNHGFHRR